MVVFGKSSNGEEGLALLVVLWVTTILTVIVGQFSYSMRAETNSTRNFRDSGIAYYHARAGAEMAYLHLLAMGQQNPKGVEGEEAALVWRVNAENPSVHLADGSFQVHLDNSSGRVNVNLAAPLLLELLFADTDIDENDLRILVDSIQDWRDKDSFHRLNGAEDDYYRFLPEPYQCRDAPFQSTEELLLVRGMTRDLFEHIKERITVYPLEVKKSSGDRKKRKRNKQNAEQNQKTININAASQEVLAMFPFMEAEAVQKIMDFRKEFDFNNSVEVKEIVGAEIHALLSKYISFDNSPCYTIFSTGMVTGTPVRKPFEVVVTVDRDKQKLEIIQVK